MGYLLLEGGAEFGGRMQDPDVRALELAGGFDAPVRILPTAAAPDNNHERAGSHGVRWFQALGARDVVSLPLIDRTSAESPDIARSLREARLIYMLGGFTGYLGETLKGSTAWDAVLDAYRSGAVIAGSSAGAMVMCELYYDPGRAQVVKGLDLVTGCIVMPHYNSFGRSWASRLLELADVTLLGIDEQTGMLDDGSGIWTVYGGGQVALYRDGQIEMYEPGKTFSV